MLIKIKDIRIDGGTQVRVEIDQATVDEYAELLEAGTKLPPLTVYHDGAAYWLADGFHRYHGARKAGLIAVACEVIKGTVAEARWAAIGANVTHGLRRRNEDKQKAVRMALELHPEYSDAVIAEHAGVSLNTVTSARRQVPQIGGPDHRIGKDGKSYPVPPPPSARQVVMTPPPSVPPSKDWNPPGGDVPRIGSPAPSIPPPPSAPPKGGPTDCFGRAIPEALRSMWERRTEVEALKARISEVRVALRKARDAGDPLYATLPQDVAVWLDNTYSELDNAKPWAVCRWCGGMSPTCRMCGGPRRGFISEFQWKTFATDEMRAAAGKG